MLAPPGLASPRSGNAPQAQPLAALPKHKYPPASPRLLPTFPFPPISSIPSISLASQLEPPPPPFLTARLSCAAPTAASLVFIAWLPIFHPYRGPGQQLRRTASALTLLVHWKNYTLSAAIPCASEVLPSLRHQTRKPPFNSPLPHSLLPRCHPLDVSPPRPMMIWPCLSDRHSLHFR